MQVQLLIGRDESTNKLTVTRGNRKTIHYELPNVPNDVKPEHCMLTITENGIVLLNGLDNLVHVDGIEIASKVINTESQVSLGQNDYVLQLSNIISDITVLKSVWSRYYYGLKRIDNRQKNDKILYGIVLPLVMSFMSLSFSFLYEYYQKILIMVSVFFASLSLFSIYRIKTDNSKWDEKELNSQFELDYICPICGTFLGNIKFDKLLFSNCEKCQTLFYSSKKKSYSSIFSDKIRNSSLINIFRYAVIALLFLAVGFGGGLCIWDYIETSSIINQLEKDMVFVEGDTYTMGAPKWDKEAYEDERPDHPATVHDFYICKHEVNQKLWRAIMGNNPSSHQGDSLPVENVTYNDCLSFIAKLNKKSGKNKYRLPTEEEWEYAARGGNKSKGHKYAGSNLLDEVAWYDMNSGDQTHNVCEKQSNELGLYDMCGNVLEWCQTIYNKKGYIGEALPDSIKAQSIKCYVLRGGSFKSKARKSRVTYRARASQNLGLNGMGLRLVK